MTLVFQEAIDYASSRRVVLPAEYYGTQQSEARTRAFSIAGVASRDQLQGVLDSLVKASSQGLTFDQWKDMVRGGSIGLNLPNYRLDNIFRTNMQTAYSVGHWKQQQNGKARRPFLMYDAINDQRVRPSHLKLDNIILPIDDPFWDEHYPPNGYRCRCSVISLTASQAEARGGVTQEPEEGWVEPDKGWKYNPGKTPDAGVAQAKLPKPDSSPEVQEQLDKQKEPTTQDLEAVAEARGTSLAAAIRAVREARQAIIDAGDRAAAEALADLTDEQQSYLRLVSEQARDLKGNQISNPATLHAQGVAGQAGTRLAAGLPSPSTVSKNSLQTVTTTAFQPIIGEAFTADGFLSAFETHQVGDCKIVIEPNARAFQVKAISATPDELEWLFPPGTRFKVLRVSGMTYYMEQTDD